MTFKFVVPVSPIKCFIPFTEGFVIDCPNGLKTALGSCVFYEYLENDCQILCISSELATSLVPISSILNPVAGTEC